MLVVDDYGTGTLEIWRAGEQCVQAEIASLRRPHGRKSLPCGQLRAAIRLNLSVRGYDHLLRTSDSGSGYLLRLLSGSAKLVWIRIGVCQASGDRKSVVWGERVSVRVDIGGRRITTKKTKNKT